MLELIESLARLLNHLFEAYPDQDSTGDMIALKPPQPTRTTFQTCRLFGFPMKLLNLPAQATHVLRGLGRILSHIIGGDIIRALGRKHQPEQFHLMTFGKILDMQGFAVLFFVLRPGQGVDSLVRTLTAPVVDLTIVFQRAVEDLVQALNLQHQFAFSIPTVHQHPTERQLLVGDGVVQHLADVVQFGFAISIWVINAVVDNPKLVRRRVDIPTCHHANALDHIVGIAAVLPTHQFDLQ